MDVFLDEFIHDMTGAIAVALPFAPVAAPATLGLLVLALVAVTPGELSARCIPDAIPLALVAATGILAVLSPRPSVVARPLAVGVAPLAQIPVPLAVVAVPLAAALGYAITALARTVTRGGIGGGDVRLATALCVATGPLVGIAGLLFASMLGLLSLIVGSKWDGSTRREASLPFGPYLVAGAICAVLAYT